MRLATTIRIYAGGPGSGRHPEGGLRPVPEKPVAFTGVWRKVPRLGRGGFISEDGKWTIKGPIFGKKMYWVYWKNMRYSTTGSYEDSVHFDSPKLAKAFVARLGSEVKAEVGYPGAGNTGVGNMIEPQPKGIVPSLKKRTKVITDKEEQALEENIMPDAAKARKQYLQRRYGKFGGLQVW